MKRLNLRKREMMIQMVLQKVFLNIQIQYAEGVRKYREYIRGKYMSVVIANKWLIRRSKFGKNLRTILNNDIHRRLTYEA